MSTDRDVERIVRSWMDEGVNALPDRVLDLVLDQIPATPQRRSSWLARRFPVMNSNIVRFGVAAAAVVLAVIIGISFIGPNVGTGPEPTATPSEPLPSLTATELTPSDALAPGTYFIRDPGVAVAQVTFTVPAGWGTIGRDILIKKQGETAGMSMSPWIVRNVYVDPCHWQASALDPPVGPGVDDLALALAAQVGRNAVGPTDVALGGYSGKLVELSVPDDFDDSTCDKGEFRTWEGGGYLYGQGQHDWVYVINVEGERLVVHATYLPEQSEAELRSIVDSIRIEGF